MHTPIFVAFAARERDLLHPKVPPDVLFFSCHQTRVSTGFLADCELTRLSSFYVGKKRSGGRRLRNAGV